MDTHTRAYRQCGVYPQSPRYSTGFRRGDRHGHDSHARRRFAQSLPEVKHGKFIGAVILFALYFCFPLMSVVFGVRINIAAKIL